MADLEVRSQVMAEFVYAKYHDCLRWILTTASSITAIRKILQNPYYDCLIAFRNSSLGLR